MRLSGFAVFNAPIVFLVLFTPNQSPLFNTSLQWLNQTYNAGMNYGNRNASSNYTTSDLAKGYTGAVVTSCGIAFTSRMLMARQLSALRGPSYVLANAALGWLSAAFAGAANLMLMRFKEIQQGILIQNESGSVTYGKSKIAGRQAVTETAISRFVLPMPVLFFPAICNFVLTKMRLMPKNVVSAKLLEATFCLGSLSVALPMSIAMFNSRAKVEAS
mmetsp:Transcript_20011/g.14491  ORF Transcript_20011/g.14491 Transcript_20011/m.14491 type:complete len:217 (+) Transcript_20011:486-1136(+)|eukprot:CAMPEP_0116879248 /NCGR_PEP_ID=MMETSP0463-20121206/11047_1 /TAXON_ID=181622 /ORGANISM="Strombidinopsis sp, Strain SopsisLIS2011" /LENGTH=216 /DNA_ID=CAMNT_0004528377 /DNA_START=416 /DNA_END=1066 /DNA_ORIENTATION=+